MNRNSKSRCGGGSRAGENCVKRNGLQVMCPGRHCVLPCPAPPALSAAPSQLQEPGQCQEQRPGHITVDPSSPITTQQSFVPQQQPQPQQLLQNLKCTDASCCGNMVNDRPISEPSPDGCSVGFPTQHQVQRQQPSVRCCHQQHPMMLMANPPWANAQPATIVGCAEGCGLTGQCQQQGCKHLHQQQQHQYQTLPKGDQQHAPGYHQQRQHVLSESQPSEAQYFLDPNCTVPVDAMQQPAVPATGCSNPKCTKCKSFK